MLLIYIINNKEMGDTNAKFKEKQRKNSVITLMALVITIIIIIIELYAYL